MGTFNVSNSVSFVFEEKKNHMNGFSLIKVITLMQESTLLTGVKRN